MRLFIAILSISFSSAFSGACTTIDADDGEQVGQLPGSDGAFVEFDPSARILPFPNDLITQFAVDPAAPRIVTLPTSCGETPTAGALREGVLNALDGFGTFKTVLRVTVSDTIDVTSLTDRVLLYKYDRSGALNLDPGSAEPIPVAAFPSATARFSEDCLNSTAVRAVNIVPTVPLEENTEYIAVLTSGILSEEGEPLLPSTTWAFVRAAENPVTVEDGQVIAHRTPFVLGDDDETLLGLDLLWKTHEAGLAFADIAQEAANGRSDMLVGFSFKTQTLSPPLDATTAGSPAAQQPAALAGVASITGPATAEQFLQGVLGVETCAALGCAAVGSLVGGAAITAEFRIPRPNPIGGATVPGPWAGPLAPTVIDSQNAAPLIVSVPALPAPEGGYPVVIYGHGITRAKTDVFAIASQLAAQGIAVVAMDWPNHGDRAVQVVDEALLGCAGDVDPSDAPQCFAPFFSGDIAATRDNFRQAVLDVQALVNALQACTPELCGGLNLDGTRIGYLGASLGAIIGTTAVAMEPDISVAVLNAGGAGLVDLIENTDSLGLRCSLVDGLIAAGVVEGEASDFSANPPTGTCLGDSWKTQPSYQSFANVGRWILDPADGVNYATRLAQSQRPVLLQKIVGDAVVPNVTTDTQAALMGLAANPADIAASPTPAPTVSLFANPGAPHLVVYGGDEVTANTFSHGSLLQPVADGAPGQLGTARLQVDAFAYLASVLAPPPIDD